MAVAVAGDWTVGAVAFAMTGQGMTGQGTVVHIGLGFGPRRSEQI
jgi:hypothetical protein